MHLLLWKPLVCCPRILMRPGPRYASSQSQSQSRLDWDPFENLYGLGMNMSPRDQCTDGRKRRSWYGPEGQYVRELPCPSCRGRGYLDCCLCTTSSREPNCPQCPSKGFKTCPECLGERVVWEESVNESAWESAHSRSPLKVADDDVIESMDIPPGPKRKANRVYGPTSVEVREKISRCLKELERRTGSISRRMRKLHQDPVLHAQRVAAIKRAKSTEQARSNISEKQKRFFQNPQHRLDRSLALKGVTYKCKSCGQEGHRSHYCPADGFVGLKDKRGGRRNKCSYCRQVGHQKRSCPHMSVTHDLSDADGGNHGLRTVVARARRCSLCKETGHNSRTCQYHKKEFCTNF